MFPILMDEPDSMTVAPSVWQSLQNAWRSVYEAPPPATHQSPPERPATPSALASLAMGAVEASGHTRH
ncbi:MULTISPECIES: hypothetical protein [Hydrogenophaga]|jgi:hypothetical protein|uniref:Uncharacterized protein n=1 Tax=Hydrogenophaga intermedia TaxID=65786 RepID=A0A1L1PA78_HYDIT|nr:MULTISPECIES: hypothetical protein [Hydrogenophaga]AOS81266.1 hypothetical protein Q5W_21115 [Hydrogenophaga sp. PBC]TMU74276.1 hypothetical protein FGJ01_14520 [Hydrogenophaga intermedia]CDN86882.1 hypothetical protein BN948_01300 [Hydrogenophaga intermedia]